MTYADSLRTYVLRALRNLGRFLSAETIRKIGTLPNYMMLGRWLKDKDFEVKEWFRSRTELWDHVALEIGEQKVLYLEFGVWQGAATRYWCNLLKHSDSELHGFDSFEGLPEVWNTQFPKGAFDVDGKIPKIDDPRVHFHKGWIEDTLSQWQPPTGFDQLFINLDLDIYSSTKTALTYLEPLIVPGTLIYFDEFADREHELKAFDEYINLTGQQFEIVGANPIVQLVVFRRLA